MPLCARVATRFGKAFWVHCASSAMLPDVSTAMMRSAGSTPACASADTSAQPPPAPPDPFDPTTGSPPLPTALAAPLPAGEPAAAASSDLSELAEQAAII